jgi:hypothetical protein
VGRKKGERLPETQLAPRMPAMAAMEVEEVMFNAAVWYHDSVIVF